MYIHGHYYNEMNQMISVSILTKGDRTEEVEIGGDDSFLLFFNDDPVEITSQVNDTFDHLLKNQARVSLLAKNFMGDFFCSSCRDVIVNIRQDGKCIFAGFIEPQSFSQGYNEEYDTIDLNCIDYLSALQYSNYRNIGAVAENHALRIQTGVLNEIMSEAVALQQPPSDKGKRLRLYYITQVGVKPPTFVIFVNDKELMHFSYTRYIENKIREAFGFKGTPLRFIIRERKENK